MLSDVVARAEDVIGWTTYSKVSHHEILTPGFQYTYTAVAIIHHARPGHFTFTYIICTFHY